MMRHLVLVAAILIIFIIGQAPNAVLYDLIFFCFGALLFLPNNLISCEAIFQIFQVLPFIPFMFLVFLLATGLLGLAELEG